MILNARQASRLLQAALGGLLGVLACATANAGEQDHEVEHGFRNALGIKAGSHHEDGQDDLLVGIEYTRILSPRLGITVALEQVDAPELDRDIALAVPVRVVFAERWSFLIGPGIEYTKDLHDDSENELFFRTGFGVGFEFGDGWFLEPLVELDIFRREEKYFVGVKFGKAF